VLRRETHIYVTYGSDKLKDSSKLKLNTEMGRTEMMPSQKKAPSGNGSRTWTLVAS
jgi:hypothetical protein